MSLARSNVVKEKRIGTLVVILFAGFLRPSELLELERSDVILSKTSVELRLKKSKKNQRGSPEPVFIARTLKDWCPVELLGEWMKGCPHSRFLFPALSGKDRAWSYNAALEELKKATSRFGIKRNITLHSFRGSAATVAVEKGVSGEELDRACRWKSSNSKKSYVQNSERTTKNAAALLSHL
uniref:Tyr recombinase domain-containing protein n=1 Tax=Panagrolaimus sp. ES5 TaxID=591445 RepID=A0AC34GJT4_9BILA